jgi:hypothetical protein
MSDLRAYSIAELAKELEARRAEEEDFSGLPFAYKIASLLHSLQCDEDATYIPRRYHVGKTDLSCMWDYEKENFSDCWVCKHHSEYADRADRLIARLEPARNQFEGALFTLRFLLS